MIRLRQLMLEYDEDLLNKKVKYQDRKTGKQHTVKVASALTYDKQHPAYKAAMQLTKGKSKGELQADKQKKQEPKQSVDATAQRQQALGAKNAQQQKKQQPKKDDSGKGVADAEAQKEKQKKTAQMFATNAHDQAEKKNDTGKQPEQHNAHNSHKPKNLTRRERVSIAALDIAVKALHVPGLEYLAGQTEKHADTFKEVLKSHKEVSGFLNKVKTVGGKTMQLLKGAGQKAMKDFSNSLVDENTGHRKSLGRIIKDKGVAVCQGVYDGVKDEFKHIAHGMRDGVEVAKKVIKEGPKSIDEDDKDKITNCIRAVANVAVIGLAVSAAFPLGMTLKAASLGIHPGHALRGLITADVYSELQRRGLLNVIRESRLSEHQMYIEQIMVLLEENIESLDDSKLLRFLLLEGANELENANPLKDYSESDMNKYAAYGVYANDLIAGRDDQEMRDAVKSASKKGQ